jgi:hypothetical protein
MSLLTSFPIEIFLIIQEYLSYQEYRLFLSLSNNSHFQKIKYETVILKFSLDCQPSSMMMELEVVQRLLRLKDILNNLVYICRISPKHH